MDEAARPPLHTSHIAGRVRELARLGAAVDDASRGRPGAVFVHGEAGVGKTRLVRAAADAAQARGFAVLRGSCLRFGAVESVLLPWVVALDGWLTAAPEDERRALIESVPDAGRLLPSLGGGAQDGATQLMRVAEALLAQIVARHPTVLVLDDVQWADAASRDAVSYSVAGFARQRLLVLGTCRDEGLAPGDPTYGWLADLRRLPQVTELVLDRLTREETEEQVAVLLGTTPAPGLVDAVQQRSAGNAYLTELLVQRADPASDRLPDDLPTDLATALLAAWHRLSPDCRSVVRVLAVAGRPVPLERLVAVCSAAGLAPDDARRAVAEAVTAGPVVTVDDALWLRHPLLAEVLYDTYLPGEAAPVHRAWAEALEAAGEKDGVAELRRLGDLALHRERAGDADATFVASLAAADEARRLHVWRDEPVHLQRAARLWSSAEPGSRDGWDEAALLERAAVASARVGQDREGVELGRRALTLALRAGDRLQASRLTTWVAGAAWWLGESDDETQLGSAQTAVDLAAGQPDSREYADALTFLADTLMWDGRWRRAAEVADEAVAAARRSSSTEALAQALGTRSAIPFREDGGRADSREGLRLAVQCGDPDVLQWAAQSRINVLIAHGRLREALEVSSWVLGQSLDSGALGSALWHASGAAQMLADAGRLGEASATVRTGLGLTGVGNGAAALRLAAMVTAVRRGDLAAARLHLERAHEQIPRLELRPGLEAPPRQAELLLAERRPDDAIGLLVATTPAQSVDSRVTDSMVLWGVRAAADLAVRARDRRDRRGARHARRALREVARARDEVPVDPFTGPDPRDPVLEAWRRMRDAELARFDGSPDQPDRWAVAVRCCRTAGLGWDAAVSTLRWCQSMLDDGAARHRVAGPLRDAHAYAVRESAQGLAADVEALATSARIPLLAVADAPLPSQRQGEAGPLATLTRREREVLDHLVAGRTYGEIARALFISEKTVSAHVSNLLRKTGTTSRHEASALALRVSAAPR